MSRPRGESRGNVRTLGQAGSEPGVWPARHLLPRVTLPTRDRIWKQGFADDVKVKVETRPHRQAGQWPRGGRGGWDHSSSPGAERLGAGSPLPSPPPSLRSGGPVTLGPPTPDSRPPALRTDPRLAGPGRGRWFGWAPRKGDQDGPVWAGPPPSPPPAHLHDRLLLFHVAGAGAWRLLRAGAAAGRSGREHRGVFISARVASSAGEGGVRYPRGGTGLRPHALLPRDRPAPRGPGRVGAGPHCQACVQDQDRGRSEHV